MQLTLTSAPSRPSWGRIEETAAMLRWNGSEPLSVHLENCRRDHEWQDACLKGSEERTGSKIVA